MRKIQKYIAGMKGLWLITFKVYECNIFKSSEVEVIEQFSHICFMRTKIDENRREREYDIYMITDNSNKITVKHLYRHQ